MMSPLKGKSRVSPGASSCRTVLAERRQACLRQSTKPSIGSDCRNAFLSESESLANLQFLSGSARRLLSRYYPLPRLHRRASPSNHDVYCIARNYSMLRTPYEGLFKFV